MNEIVRKREIAPSTYRYDIRNPKVAQKRRAGQFVLVRVHEGGERVPLTIVDSDPTAGTVTLIFQAVGHSTRELARLPEGASVMDLVGPLGRPTAIEKHGTACVIGGGYGTAPVLPIARALRDAGNELIGIIGARTKDLVILEEDLRAICPRVEISTDDGSYGQRGFVTDVLRRLLDEGQRVDFVLAVGPTPMMRAVAELTRERGIRTMVSLNPIMVDGTGMCGGCRVEVDGETKFACVDGPEFDAHLVNFDLLMKRQGTYRAQEETAAESDAHCRIGLPWGPARATEVAPPVHTAPASDEPLQAWKRPREPMPEQPAEERVLNFDEVPLGYSPEQAVREAERCLMCKNPRCIEGCPVEVDIPGFILLVREGDFVGAARKIRETNMLPAVCGRVCPQESQCEAVCVLAKRGEPVAVGRLERFVADYEREHGLEEPLQQAPPTGKRIAVVGSGPAGLTCAADLARLGHDVTVFEALHEFGGVLVYGIPEFRLPKRILRSEVERLRELGVKLEKNAVIGKLDTVENLMHDEGFDAVFIGTGAGLPVFMGIPGENLLGVYSANEYLTRSNLMRAYEAEGADTPIARGKRVMVVGGGNVAMDAARTAIRLRAERVILAYRRSRDEMPARIEEIAHAEEEGVDFQLLTVPIEFLGDEQGRLRAATMQRMELGEPDADGRRRPVPIVGSEYEEPIDVAVIAIGAGANPLIRQTTPGLEVNRKGYIVTDPETGATSLPGVYAGGDIVTGSATVIEAMGAGRRAAAAIHRYLTESGPRED